MQEVRVAPRFCAGLHARWTAYSIRRMNVDRLIVRSLWIGGALLMVLAVAGLLWLALFALGDRGGAAIMRGLVLLVFAVWSANFVALVVLLAVARLTDRRAAETATPIPPRESNRDDHLAAPSGDPAATREP